MPDDSRQAMKILDQFARIVRGSERTVQEMAEISRLIVSDLKGAPPAGLEAIIARLHEMEERNARYVRPYRLQLAARKEHFVQHPDRKFRMKGLMLINRYEHALDDQLKVLRDALGEVMALRPAAADQEGEVRDDPDDLLRHLEDLIN